jgi:hypothetical protein
MILTPSNALDFESLQNMQEYVDRNHARRY